MVNKCKQCGSHAINHNSHGRDGTDGELCDVCYWRKRALIDAQPVAWLSVDSIGERYLCFTRPDDGDTVQPLYTASQPKS